LPSIINLLLTLPRLGNPYLSQSAYSILCEIFTVTSQGEDGGNVVDISEILKVILSSPPLLSDFALSSAWVQVLGNAMLGYSNVDPDSCSAQIDKVWKAVWVFLESSDSSTRRAAAESLKLLTCCFSPKLLQSAIHEDGSGQTKSTLRKIIVETMNALGSLAFARSIPELLSIISSLIDNLADRPSRMSPTYAESLVLDLIQKVGDLRIQKGFEYKEAADDTLAVAMRVVGPEVLLRVLPLNLEPSDRYVDVLGH
jgi:ribosomal RNA-processing protein 12